jgi:hypothetical protein
VIEVAVREDDGGRRRVAELARRPAPDPPGRAIEPRVDERPPVVRRDREDVGEQDGEPGDAVRHGLERNHLGLGNLDMIHGDLGSYARRGRRRDRASM